MLIKLKELQEVCSSILPAVDSTEIANITETLALKVEENILSLSVTNREYFVKFNLPVQESSFNATVNAQLFLKLVSQMTTEFLELEVKETNLVLKGNGKYKLPLIFDNDKLLELPEITINNITCEFDMDGNILNSILIHNTKQLNMGIVSKLIQKMYYVDEKGALTFTNGACINKFILPKPVKLLFNKRVVNLFKLFKDQQVHFSLGYDSISDDIIQTKVQFKTKDICLTAILSCDDTLLNSVPVTAIRGRADNIYPYSVVVNKNSLKNTINRMRLFVSDNKNATSFSKFHMTSSSMTISDLKDENSETVNYDNEVVLLKDKSYDMVLDLNDLQAVLDTCFENNIQINFGDSQAITITRNNIINVVPEVEL